MTRKLSVMTPDLRHELQQQKPFGSIQQEAQLSVVRTGSMLVVLVGTSVLAVDGTRYISLQSQLQHGADAPALATASATGQLSLVLVAP